jgi:multicomponent Na+:H+ antiporter subunit D
MNDLSSLIPLAFATPLAASAIGMLLRGRRGSQRGLTLAATATVLAIGAALLPTTREGAVLAVDVGAWPDGLAIVLAVDALAALMLCIAAASALLALAVAWARGEDDHPLFHPLAAALLSGAVLAFVTADLFNLFVAFEVMLIASYVLLALRGGRDQVRAGVIYVGTNLLASTLFLLGVALVYGATGTVNLARLASAVPGDPAAMAGMSLVLVAVAAKAALVPLHGWLPRTYVHAGPAVTVLFSGILTKVGVYVLYRLTQLVLVDVPGAATPIVAVAVVTMVVGVIGAVGGTDMRGILTFHMVSQVGYLVLPLGLMTLDAVAAGVLYLVQYVAVKAALLAVAAATRSLEGTDRLKELGGLWRTRPWLGVAFLLPALALAGLPPTTGFLGKYLLVSAAFDARAWVGGATMVAVSLLTLLSMVKIFTGAFWGAPAARPADGHVVTTVQRRTLIGIPLVVGIAAVVLGPAGAPLLDLARDVAAGMIDPAAYLEAVVRP